MLWWFLILGVSAAVIVAVASALFMRVRGQMELQRLRKNELDERDRTDVSVAPKID